MLSGGGLWSQLSVSIPLSSLRIYLSDHYQASLLQAFLCLFNIAMVELGLLSLISLFLAVWSFLSLFLSSEIVFESGPQPLESFGNIRQYRGRLGLHGLEIAYLICVFCVIGAVILLICISVGIVRTRQWRRNPIKMKVTRAFVVLAWHLSLYLSLAMIGCLPHAGNRWCS